MKYEKQKRIRAERSLLGSGSGVDGNKQVVLEETVEEAKAMDNAMPIIPYYHPNITLAVIGNAGAIPQAQLTPVVARCQCFPACDRLARPILMLMSDHQTSTASPRQRVRSTLASTPSYSQTSSGS